MTKAYHYTSTKAWKEMSKGQRADQFYDPQSGKRMRGSLKVFGLWPREQHFISPEITNLPPEAYLPASYAFFEPEPPQWISNKKYGNRWRYLMDYLTDHYNNSTVLLGVDLTPRDRVYIADAAYVPLVEGMSFSDPLIQQSYRNYWASCRTLNEYIYDEKTRREFTLPEVVIQNVIPLKRLNAIWTKPNSAVLKRALEVSSS